MSILKASVPSLPLIMLHTLVVCLTAVPASAQTTPSVLIDLLVLDEAYTKASPADIPGTCTVADSADVLMWRQQTWEVWGEIVCPNGRYWWWDYQRPALRADGQCNYFSPCTPAFSEPQSWEAGAFHFWKLVANTYVVFAQFDSEGNALPGVCLPAGSKETQAQVSRRAVRCSLCSEDPETVVCPEEGYLYDPVTCLCTPSPIFVDTAGNGYDLTSAGDGVQFRFTPGGRVVTAAWTKANSDDALLVLDRNGNGLKC